MPGSWPRLGCHIGTACRRRVVYVLLDRHTVIATPSNARSSSLGLVLDGRTNRTAAVQKRQFEEVWEQTLKATRIGQVKVTSMQSTSQDLPPTDYQWHSHCAKVTGFTPSRRINKEQILVSTKIQFKGKYDRPVPMN